jgi:2-aminoadipate transaminase
VPPPAATPKLSAVVGWGRGCSSSPFEGADDFVLIVLGATGILSVAPASITQICWKSCDLSGVPSVRTEPFVVPNANAPYSRRGASIRGSAIDSSLTVLAAADWPVVSFAMGSPAPDAIPVDAIAAAATSILRGVDGPSALDYAPTEGHPKLRQALGARLATQGTAVDPSCLLITAGGMQGLDLVYKLFLEPGDLVLAESPSYANGLATAHNYGADILQIAVGEDGLDLDQAEAAVRSAGRVPKLVYAIPTFQNPSGRSYTEACRLKLLELARSWGAMVIEDDPYSELRYDGPSYPSLLELDGLSGTVIQVRTFSKIVAPGLRVGWVVAPSDTIRRMTAAKQSMDTCANPLAQLVAAQLIRDGDVDRHVTMLNSLYPRRRDRMIAALEREFGTDLGATWTSPSGGMFIWVELPQGLDGDSILGAALPRGVAMVPGSAFDPIRSRSAFRLCFSAVDEVSIDLGIERLAAVVRDMAASADAVHRRPGAQRVSPGGGRQDE